jgi:hypothetical protein
MQKRTHVFQIERLQFNQRQIQALPHCLLGLSYPDFEYPLVRPQYPTQNCIRQQFMHVGLSLAVAVPFEATFFLISIPWGAYDLRLKL